MRTCIIANIRINIRGRITWKRNRAHKNAERDSNARNDGELVLSYIIECRDNKMYTHFRGAYLRRVMK